jgi:hypothetical protein
MHEAPTHAIRIRRLKLIKIKKVSGAALGRDFEAKECACRNPDAQQRDRYDD